MKRGLLARRLLRRRSSGSALSLTPTSWCSHLEQPATGKVYSTANDVTVTRYSDSVPSLSNEEVSATELVDDLLEYTRHLMDAGLLESTAPRQHVIAFSGGVDSSVVTALIHQVAHPPPQEVVRAVLGLSPAVPAEQVALAEQVADVIGVSLEQIPTTEGSDAAYIENNGQACIACKTHLYTCLESIAQHAEGYNNVDSKPQQQRVQLYNGTNADDGKDPTRLGLIAADEFDVQSPLRYTTKENVRRAGKHLGLPNWNHAASPCLRSRLALGVQAIPQHLERIERGERYIRQSLELDPTCNLRVRLLTKNRAVVEIQSYRLGEAKRKLEDWQPYFQNSLGFASLDVRCFKSGSVAQLVEPTYIPARPAAKLGN